MRPVVLQHVHPNRKYSDTGPQCQRVFPVAEYQPQQTETGDVRCHRKIRVRYKSENPGFENCVAGHVRYTAVGEKAIIKSLPESIVATLVRVAIVVRIDVMMSVPINP